MIPTYIFKKEDFKKAIKSCDNCINALPVWVISETDKLFYKNLFLKLKRQYKKSLAEFNRTEKAKNIKTTFEIVSNE